MKARKFLLTFISTAALTVWAIWSFVEWDINPGHWSGLARVTGACAWASLVWLLIACLVQVLEEKKLKAGDGR